MSTMARDLDSYSNRGLQQATLFLPTLAMSLSFNRGIVGIGLIINNGLA